MFAEHDQLPAWHGLGGIHVEKKLVGGWAAGTTFRGEQFDENGMSLRARRVRRGRIAVATCHPTNHESKNANAND